MGDRVYYVAFMKMKDVAERVRIAEEIHKSEKLNQLIQRKLSDRAPAIRDYLLNQPQRFFNAFVIGVYGGHPQWLELEIHDNPMFDIDDDIPQYLEGALGFLVLEGGEKLFALDGQHRVAGIREAVAVSEERGSEEVATIFVSHSNDDEGMARTRRLFTTLNRYAKPLNKREAIALDEDDAVAIITRKLVEEHPFFRDRVNTKRSKSLPKSDRVNITTIIALYDALDNYLRDRSPKAWSKFKRERPSDNELNDIYGRITDLWNHLSNSFGVLTEYGKSKAAKPAEPYRHDKGGHLLFRPVGLMMIINTIKLLESQGVSTQRAVERVAQVPMNVEDSPWTSLLWDPQNNRMITAAENQRAANRLLLYSAGGDLSALKTSAQDLKEELAGLLNRTPEEITLPQYAS